MREAGENSAANASMATRFVELNLTALAHTGRSDDGLWMEEGFFVPGLNAGDGLTIASEFEQHAIVFVPLGGTAELLLTGITAIGDARR